MALVGTNVKVEVQQTLGSNLPSITAVTAANPAVVSSTAHGLANTDVVVFTVTSGMVQLDGQAARVANVTANTFELEGLDATTFSTWATAAGNVANKVTVFATLSSAQSITMPSPAPAKLDTTTLIDVQKQYVYGLPDAPDGSITTLFNPAGGAEALITKATNTNARMVFRVTFAGGQHTIFDANVSGGAGFDMQQNAVAHSTIAFTPVRQVLHYAT